MGYDIVHELDIAAPPAAVFDAVTNEAGLQGWWTTAATAEPEVGGRVRAEFPGTGTAFTLTVDLVEAPELVHWRCTEGPEEWVGTTLAFRIEAADGGSVVRFWHGGWEYEDGLLPRTSFSWAMFLDSLRRYLETGTGSPHGG